MVADPVLDRLRGRVARQRRRHLEGAAPGVDEGVLVRRRRHPVLAGGVLPGDLAVHRVGVPLAPEAHQAVGDEGQARVAVVLLAQGRDEAGEHRHHLGVVVVRRQRLARRVAVERVVVGRHRAGAQQVGRDAAGAPGVVDVEAQHRLVPTRGDGIEVRIEPVPRVRAGSGDDVADRQRQPLHRVGRGVLLQRRRVGGVRRREGHHPLERVGLRRGRRGDLDPGPVAVAGPEPGGQGHHGDERHEDGAQARLAPPAEPVEHLVSQGGSAIGTWAVRLLRGRRRGAGSCCRSGLVVL